MSSGLALVVLGGESAVEGPHVEHAPDAPLESLDVVADVPDAVQDVTVGGWSATVASSLGL